MSSCSSKTMPLTSGGVKCPKGKILIRGYKKKSGVRVRLHCTPDRGAVGRTPKSKRVLPKLKEDEFAGYKYSTKLPSSKRLSILKKICKDLTYSSVIKRLVVLRSYNKRNPKLYAKFDKDIKTLQKWHMKGGVKSKKSKKSKSKKD
jgi:hypothetical protein